MAANEQLPLNLRARSAEPSSKRTGPLFYARIAAQHLSNRLRETPQSDVVIVTRQHGILTHAATGRPVLVARAGTFFQPGQEWIPKLDDPAIGLKFADATVRLFDTTLLLPSSELPAGQDLFTFTAPNSRAFAFRPLRGLTRNTLIDPPALCGSDNVCTRCSCWMQCLCRKVIHGRIFTLGIESLPLSLLQRAGLRYVGDRNTGWVDFEPWTLYHCASWTSSVIDGLPLPGLTWRLSAEEIENKQTYRIVEYVEDEKNDRSQEEQQDRRDGEARGRDE